MRATTRETCSRTDRNQRPRCVPLIRKGPAHATGCPRGASPQYSLRCAPSVPEEQEGALRSHGAAAGCAPGPRRVGRLDSPSRGRAPGRKRPRWATRPQSREASSGSGPCAGLAPSGRPLGDAVRTVSPPSPPEGVFRPRVPQRASLARCRAPTRGAVAAMARRGCYQAGCHPSQRKPRHWALMTTPHPLTGPRPTVDPASPAPAPAPPPAPPSLRPLLRVPRARREVFSRDCPARARKRHCGPFAGGRSLLRSL